jgi:hypothetical protein
MTEAESLIETRLQWIAMLEAGATSARDKESVYPKSKHWEYHCALCEYCGQVHVDGCDNCPLFGLWNIDSKRSECTNLLSPYYSFYLDQGTPSDALKIVRLTEQKLAEIGEPVEPYKESAK